VFGVGQPALLYISPGILIPTAIASYSKGDYHKMWNKLDDNEFGNERQDFEVCVKEANINELPKTD